MGETGTPVAYRTSITQVKSTRTIQDVADAACYMRNTGTLASRIPSALELWMATGQTVADGNRANWCEWQQGKLLWTSTEQTVVDGNRANCCGWQQGKLLWMATGQTAVDGNRANCCGWQQCKLLWMATGQTVVDGNRANFCGWQQGKLLWMATELTFVDGNMQTAEQTRNSEDLCKASAGFSRIMLTASH